MISIRNTLISGLALVAMIATWRLFFSAPSPATLTEQALNAEDSATRQQAALGLIATDEPQDFVQRVLVESNDPAVRAIAIQGVGESGDTAAVDGLIKELGSKSQATQASAAGALSKLLRYDVEYPVGASASERRLAATEIRDTWEKLKRYELVEELANTTSLHYFFDQKRGEIFAAPSHMPDAFDLPGGRYQGMPAAVRARVFSRADCDDPDQQFVGWLVVPASILTQYSVALPAGGPPGDTLDLLIRRPQDQDWVYISSPLGEQIIFGVYGSEDESDRPTQPCLPKKLSR